MLRSPSSFKEMIAEGLETLGPRIHNSRPDFISP